MSNQYNKSDNEGFCTSCSGDGLDVTGIGDTTSSTNTNHKIWKQILLWSGIAICIIIFILLIAGVFV